MYKLHFLRNVPFPRTRERILFPHSSKRFSFWLSLHLVLIMSHFFSYFCPSVSSSSFSLPTQPSNCRSWHCPPVLTLFYPSPVFCNKLSTFPLLLYLPDSLSAVPFSTLAVILTIFLQNLSCTRSIISHPIYPPNFRPTQQPLFTYQPLDIL